MILEENTIFTQQIDFGKTVNLSLLIAEPRSDFNGSRKTTTEYYLKQSLCDFEALKSKDRYSRDLKVL